MEKILDGLHTWRIFNEEKKLNFNGLYLKTAGSFLLIDPPPMAEQEIQFVEKTGKPTKILLTNKHHTRASSQFRDRWSSKILIHEKDKPLMEIAVDGIFSDGEILEEEFQAIRIPHAKTPGEVAFSWDKNKIMIVGDAVIGKPEGALSMLPDEKFKDPNLARKGLTVLLEKPFERLLVGDGTSILQNAHAVLENFLQQQLQGLS